MDVSGNQVNLGKVRLCCDWIPWRGLVPDFAMTENVADFRSEHINRSDG